MFSHVLPIVALAGTALASTACPLAVSIANTEAHVANVVITNTADEAVTFFKGNTALSDHATKDLVVEDAGMWTCLDLHFRWSLKPALIRRKDGTALPFEGVYINHRRTALPADSFQTLQPGESITTPVNAAKSYKLAGVKSAKVTAVQSFSYITGIIAPTALKGMAICGAVSSDTVAIAPDQSKVAA